MNKFCLNLVLLLALQIPLHAGILTVTNGNDGGAGSLRSVLSIAQNGDQVAIPPGLTIMLTSGQLVVNKNLEIVGGAGSTITNSIINNTGFRLMRVEAGYVVSIRQLRFYNASYGGTGTALYNLSSNLFLQNCIFESNGTNPNVLAGNGTLVNDNVSSTASIENCIFRNNKAIAGAGINNYQSSPKITSCSFLGNSAESGCGIYNFESSPLVTNCIFLGNKATGGGGGMSNVHKSNPILNFCSFNGNSAVQGGSIANGDTTAPAIRNSILWGNSSEIFINNALVDVPVVSYSIVQGGYTGTGNLNKDPLYASPLPFATAPNTSGSLRLNACSPAINAGDAANAPLADLDGNPRIALGLPDMGAYEYQTPLMPIVYVNAGATGSNSGTSWTNAFVKLQDAIQLVLSDPCKKEIWVVAGTYYPDEGGGKTNNDRNACFQLVNGVKILGGFAGTEIQSSQRNLVLNPTILSGEIQQDTDSTNNTSSIFRNTNIDSTAILDGFIIQLGAAASTGGAMSNSAGSPIIRNCVFNYNRAVNWGGVVYNAAASNPAFINCIFANNTATNGGVVFNSASSPSFINCTAFGNASPNGSVAWSQTNSFMQLINCILWGNTGNIPLINTITSPYTVNYSLVEGGFAGTGNINVNPLFADPLNGNFTLITCSPAINAGTGTSAPATDIAGALRPAAGGYDMGAYEKQVLYPPIIFVKKDAAGSGTGANWSNAFTKLQDALGAVKFDTCVKQIWVSTGTYKTDEMDPGNSLASFTMRNGLGIYGGFSGVETNISQRNPSVNLVTLSGEIGDPGIDDNSYHVVFNNNNGLNSSAVLDGFSISGGNAAGPGIHSNGAGIYNFNASPLIRNCIINANNALQVGGGIYNDSSSPNITNSTITGNNAGNAAGGLCNYNGSNAVISNCSILLNSSQFDAGGVLNSLNSSAEFNKCTISGNTAVYGAGMYNMNNSNAAITNCQFIGNKASATGGALLNNIGSNAVVHSCSFNGNAASAGGAMALYNASSPVIRNTIFSGNFPGIYLDDAGSIPDIQYSLIEGGYPGTGNINEDAQFLSPADPLLAPALSNNTNLRLRPCSPALDNGTAAGAPNTDFDNHARPLSGAYDMGAFERAQGNNYYVDLNAKINGDGSSWLLADRALDRAVEIYNGCPSISTVLIATGSYSGLSDQLIINKPGGVFLGGYPTGGGSRNFITNPVTWNGDLQVLKPVRIDGLKLKK